MSPLKKTCLYLNELIRILNSNFIYKGFDSRRRSDGRGFSIFNIEFRSRNKSKKDYTLGRRGGKPKESDQESFSFKNSLKQLTGSTQKLSSIDTTNRELSTSLKSHSLTDNSFMNSFKRKTHAAAQLSNNVYDKQLVQLNELEKKIKAKSATDDPPTTAVDLNTKSSDPQSTQGIDIQKRFNFSKQIAGSLITATSIDSNNNLIAKARLTKHSPISYIDNTGDDEDGNFFAQFDDINFESINQIKPNGIILLLFNSYFYKIRLND